MATRSKRQHTLAGVVDVLMAAQLCCGDKAFMKELGKALEAVRVYDPRDPGVLLRQDVRDLAEELLELLDLYIPEPF